MNKTSQQPLFKKILVANRGEIALRIIKTLKEMGIASVALASTPDKTALHAQLADEVIFLEGNTSRETYLQGDQIIAVAKTLGVDAVHPGYGFLSENAAFAASCEANGMVFIGPAPQVIEQMGNKVHAKALMEKAGIPVIPGMLLTLDDAGKQAEEIIPFVATPATLAAIANIGYPVIVKASVGGGGRGMRRVDSEKQLLEAVESARRESRQAFGNNEVFIEKYIEQPRHIEFQVLGDLHHQFIHLFERECSIQRRHQKMIEESPSVMLDVDLRHTMGAMAVKAVETVGYTNAGTVEFIVAPDGSFYFLEMNTRLQVEHPVTEMVTGYDLVRLQVMIAARQPIPFKQKDLRLTGHAIECRVCAENPLRSFMPATGQLTFFRPPAMPFVRVDSGFAEGDTISMHYDSMLAKVIAYGVNRQDALDKMQQALAEFVIVGIENNIAFLQAILQHPLFVAGKLQTHFIEEAMPLLLEHATPAKPADWPVDVLLTAGLLLEQNAQAAMANTGNGRGVFDEANADALYNPWFNLPENRRLQP